MDQKPMRLNRKGRVPFPDLSISPRNLRVSAKELHVVPTSDRIFSDTTKPKVYGETPANFAVGWNHKQGLTLFSKDNLQWAGGKKT